MPNLTPGQYSPEFFMTYYSGDVNSTTDPITKEIQHNRNFLDIQGSWYLVQDGSNQLVETKETQSYRIDLTQTNNPLIKQVSDAIAEITEIVGQIIAQIPQPSDPDELIENTEEANDEEE